MILKLGSALGQIQPSLLHRPQYSIDNMATSSAFTCNITTNNNDTGSTNINNKLGPTKLVNSSGICRRRHSYIRHCSCCSVWLRPTSARLGDALRSERPSVLRRSQRAHDHMATAYSEHCGHISVVADPTRP